ncbi:MAG: hypothetical protein AB1427_19415 [Thermodesulfobacteriota bacterium]
MRRDLGKAKLPHLKALVHLERVFASAFDHGAVTEVFRPGIGRKEWIAVKRGSHHCHYR